MAFFSSKTAAAADLKPRIQTTRAGGVLGGAQRGIRYTPPADRVVSDSPDIIAEPTNNENNAGFIDLGDSGRQSSSAASYALPGRSSSRQSAYRATGFHPSQLEAQVHHSDVASDITRPESAEEQSGPGSTSTYETDATSIHTLPALQTKGPAQEYDHLEPVSEDDPSSYDLLEPAELQRPQQTFDLESRAQLLFSTEHLQAIFDDPQMLLKFTSFLGTHRPASVPTLIYYLDAMKALRAIRYANAVAEALDPLPGHEFTSSVAPATRNLGLEEKAQRAFQALVEEALPAYITDTWVRVVSTTIHRRIIGSLPPHLREASEGLAEVFCLSDPSRPDNPIVFASEEFHRTTQYGMSYAIGRNCRFLQGPMTSRDSVRRLRDAVVAGKDHCETFVNYRRDGSPFMNLLMVAPLRDSRGNLRYYIGAQVDVTGLAKECTNLEALPRMLGAQTEVKEDGHVLKKDEFQELSEMFNLAELDIVRKYGGRMHREQIEEKDDSAAAWHRPRLLLQEYSTDDVETMVMPNEISRPPVHGKLSGVYQNVRLLDNSLSIELTESVPSHPTIPLITHIVCLPFAACSRHSPIAFHESNWRFRARARRARGCPSRWPWCDRQDPLGFAQRGRGPQSMGTLHTSNGRKRSDWSVDGGPGGRRELTTRAQISSCPTRRAGHQR